jgi:hypothetical protein
VSWQGESRSDGAEGDRAPHGARGVRMLDGADDAFPDAFVSSEDYWLSLVPRRDPSDQ